MALWPPQRARRWRDLPRWHKVGVGVLLVVSAALVLPAAVSLGNEAWALRIESRTGIPLDWAPAAGVLPLASAALLPWPATRQAGAFVFMAWYTALWLLVMWRANQPAPWLALLVLWSAFVVWRGPTAENDARQRGTTAGGRKPFECGTCWTRIVLTRDEVEDALRSGTTVACPSCGH